MRISKKRGFYWVFYCVIYDTRYILMWLVPVKIEKGILKLSEFKRSYLIEYLLYVFFIKFLFNKSLMYLYFWALESLRGEFKTSLADKVFLLVNLDITKDW